MSTAKSTARRTARKFGTELPLNSPGPVVSAKKSAGKQSRNNNADGGSAATATAVAAVETDVVASTLKSANVANAAAAAATPLTNASDARRNLELEGSLQRAQQQQEQQATMTTTTTTTKKKKVRVKKTPRSISTKSNASTRRTQKHHEDEYTVQFAPGPLGMKLEPITTVTSPVSISGTGSGGSPGTAATQTKMLGCRVVRFVNNSTPTRTTTSQARNFGVIHPGDVVVGIDGVDVSTWEYSRVIELLKKKKKDGNAGEGNDETKKEEARGKAITFRAVGVRKSAVTTSDTTTNDAGASNTSTNRVLAFDSSTAAGAAADTAANTNASSATDDEEDGRMITIDLNPLVEDVGTTSIVTANASHVPSGLFSPSNVKKLRKQKEQLQSIDESLRETPEFRSKDVLLCGNSSVLSAVAGGDKSGAESTMTAEQYQGRVSGLLSNVVSQTLLPAVSTVYSNLSTSASVADATVGKIGEALVGHSEQEFQEAVAAKMRLLHELSEVRATLGEDEETKRELASKVDTLQKERDDAIKARGIFEEALQTAQREGDELRAAIEATAGELTATKMESVEAIASANKLAAQNELLRAQTEQLRGHFGNKEREMSEGLAAAQSQLNERVEAIRILQEQIARYEEQLRIQSENAVVSSQELVAASASVKTYEEQLRTEQNALKEANDSIDKLRVKISELEQSLVETSEKADTERSETEENHKIDLGKMNDQISALQGDLDAALSTKSSLEDELSRVTSALEGDVGKMQEEMGRVQIELQDRITGLEDKLESAMSARSSLEGDLSRMSSEMEEKNVEISAQQTELEAIRGELEAALSARASLEGDISRIASEVEEKNAKITDQQAQMEAQEAQIRELQAKIADSIEELQKKAGDAAVNWEAKEKELIAELNEQRDRAETASTELKQQMAEFEAKLAEEASAKTLLNEEVQRLTDDFAESQDSLEEAKKLIESHEMELAKVQKEMPTQIQELRRQAEDAANTWRSKEAELTKEIKRQKGLVEEATAVSQAKEEYYENAMRKLQTRFDAKKEIINKINQKHAESTAKLEANIDALKADIAQKEAQLLKVESERNGDSTLLQSQLDATTREKEEMEREVESLSAKCNALQKIIDEVNEKYERLQSERDMIEIEKQSLTSKLSMEANAYTKAKAAHANELEKVKKDAEDQRKVFEEKVDALIAEVERVESFMSSEHSKLESLNKELNQSLVAKNDEIAILQSQLDSTEKKSSQDMESSTAEVFELRRELGTVRHRLNEAEANIKEEETKVMEAQATIRDREQALCLALLRQNKDKEHYDDAMSQREVQLTEMANKLSTAESQIKTIEAEKQQDSAAAESNISHLVEVAEKADIRANEYKALLDERKKVLDSVENCLLNSCEQLEIHYPGPESLVGAIEALAEKASMALDQSSNRQNDVAKVEEQLFQLRAAFNATAESLGQCETSRDQWETRALSAEQELDALRVQVASLETDLGVSTEANDALSQNIESLKTSMDAMKTSRDCLDEALSKEIEEKRDLSTRVGFLEQKLSLKAEECERFESSVNNVEQKFEAAEVAKRLEIESKSLELQDSQAMVEALQRDLDERNFAVELAETRLSKAQEIIATKSSELAVSSQTIEEQAAELTRSTECSKNLQEERDAMFNDLQYLQSFLDGNENVGEKLSSDAALFMFERIGELLEKNKQQDNQEMPPRARRRQPPKPEVLETPTGSKINKVAERKGVPTPSKMLSPLLSPSFTTGIVSKHANMLDELKMLKATISQAVVASPDESSNGKDIIATEDENEGEEISCQTKTNDTQSLLLSTTEKAMETLVADLSSAQAALSEKEGLLHEVANAVNEIEIEREELQHKVDTMQCYTQRMEETLTRELKWRKKAEAELKRLRQKANGRKERNESREEQIKRTVAAEVASQLETTRQKLLHLKDYLREGGIVSAEDPQYSPVFSSTESFNWDISNDADEE